MLPPDLSDAELQGRFCSMTSRSCERIIRRRGARPGASQAQVNPRDTPLSKWIGDPHGTMHLGMARTNRNPAVSAPSHICLCVQTAERSLHFFTLSPSGYLRKLAAVPPSMVNPATHSLYGIALCGVTFTAHKIIYLFPLRYKKHTLGFVSSSWLISYTTNTSAGSEKKNTVLLLLIKKRVSVSQTTMCWLTDGGLP